MNKSKGGYAGCILGSVLLDVLRHSLRSSGAVQGEAMDELRVHDRAPMSLEYVDRPYWVFDVAHLVDRLDLLTGGCKR